MFKNFWILTGFCFLGIVLAAVFFEFGLRILTPEPENLAKIRSSSLFLYENKPDAVFPYVRGGEFNVLVKFNSHGFRDDEFKISKDPATIRIAILGDSFEEALQVEVEDTWQKVMARKLAQTSSRKVEAYNFAVSGYGTDQEWLTLREKVWQFSPDLVILAFSPNDVGDTYKNELVRIEDKRIKVMSPHERVGGNLLGKLARETYTYHLVIRASSRGDFAKRVVDKLRTEILGFASEERFFLSDAQLVDGPFEVIASQKSPPPEVISGWELVRALLEDIKSQSRERNVPFLLTINITRPQVDEGDWAVQRDLYKLDPETSSPYQINEVLATIAKDLAIYFYDGRRDAVFWKAQYGDLHLPIDTHYNSRGHEFMGTEVAEFILKNIDYIFRP